jgi:membrane protein
VSNSSQTVANRKQLPPGRLSASWLLLKDTAVEWQRDNTGRSAAALAFYTLFSLAPSLMIILAVAGLFAGRLAAETELLRQIQAFIGPRAASFVQVLSEGASEGSGAAPTLISVVLALLGATAVFVELQDSLNHIWGVNPKPDSFFHRLLYTRLLSFLMVLGVGLLLLIALGVGAVLAAVQSRVGDLLPVPAGLLHATGLFISFALMVVLFAAIYKILPDVMMSWKDVWIGATITALLMAGGRFLITLYLAHSSLRSVYGAAGSLVLILLWVYYSAHIFLFGAEFTQVYARRHGSNIVPARGAVWRRRPISDPE